MTFAGRDLIWRHDARVKPPNHCCILWVPDAELAIGFLRYRGWREHATRKHNASWPLGLTGLLHEPSAADAGVLALSAFGLGGKLGRGADCGCTEDAIERCGDTHGSDGHGA